MLFTKKNKMKKRKNISQEIFLIAVLLLTIAIVWIYLSVYKIIDKPSDTPLLTPQEIKIINLDFEEEIFEELEKRNI